MIRMQSKHLGHRVQQVMIEKNLNAFCSVLVYIHLNALFSGHSLLILWCSVFFLSSYATRSKAKAFDEDFQRIPLLAGAHTDRTVVKQ